MFWTQNDSDFTLLMNNNLSLKEQLQLFARQHIKLNSYVIRCLFHY